jgi:hypothetical protein
MICPLKKKICRACYHKEKHYYAKECNQVCTMFGVKAYCVEAFEIEKEEMEI